MSEKDRVLQDELETLFPVDRKYIVEDLFGSNLAKAIYKEILNSRKCNGDDDFSYSIIEKDHEGKTYVITPRHVPIGESMSYGNSSCNKCYGSGKMVINMEKSKISNTDDFIMLSDVRLDGLTEEQKKIVVEKEKQRKFWRVLLPCPCTIKKMLKKKKQIVSNDLNNIVIEITCTEKVD